MRRESRPSVPASTHQEWLGILTNVNMSRDQSTRINVKAKSVSKPWNHFFEYPNWEYIVIKSYKNVGADSFMGSARTRLRIGRPGFDSRLMVLSGSHPLHFPILLPVLTHTKYCTNKGKNATKETVKIKKTCLACSFKTRWFTSSYPLLLLNIGSTVNSCQGLPFESFSQQEMKT